MGYSFKQYLLNEDRAYFGERIGDVLNAVEDLVDNGNSMGTRQLVKKSEVIVNQIRRILHTNWPKKEEKNLEKFLLLEKKLVLNLENFLILEKRIK